MASLSNPFLLSNILEWFLTNISLVHDIVVDSIVSKVTGRLKYLYRYYRFSIKNNVKIFFALLCYNVSKIITWFASLPGSLVLQRLISTNFRSSKTKWYNVYVTFLNCHQESMLVRTTKLLDSQNRFNIFSHVQYFSPTRTRTIISSSIFTRTSNVHRHVKRASPTNFHVPRASPINFHVPRVKGSLSIHFSTM